MKKILFYLSSICVITLFAACQKDDIQPDSNFPIDEEGIEISEMAVNIDEYSDLNLISSSYEIASGVYRYRSQDATFPDFQLNSILVSGENGGYLRKVTGIEQSGTITTLNTEQASFLDLIKNGTLKLDFDFIDLAREGKNFSSETTLKEELASGIETSDNIQYNLNTSFSSQLHLEGKISYNPHFVFLIEVEDFQLKNLKIAIEQTSLSVNPSLSIATQASLNASYEQTLAQLEKRFIFPIAGFPVVMDLKMDLIGAVRANFNGQIETELAYSNISTVDFGIEYANGNTNFINDLENTSTLSNTVDIDAQGQTTLYVIPQMYVEFYGALSTAIKAEPYIELFATEQNAPELEVCTEINAGIDFTLGFNASVLWYELLNESKMIKGPKTNLWSSGENCEIKKIKLMNPTFSTSDPSLCDFGYDVLYFLNYEYEYEDGSPLAEPATMVLFWRDNNGVSDDLIFTLSDYDPYQTITPESFSHGLCVDYDGRSSYEVSSYIIDQNGVQSNYVSYLLIY